MSLLNVKPKDAGWPSWLRTVYSYKGLKEIPGPKHNPIIQGWLKYLNAWWNDDETPWCGVILGYAFKQNGYKIPKLYMRAKAWLNWGIEIQQPVLGCVAVLERKGGGHVFLVIGITPSGNPIGVGGNQGNNVTVAEFSKNRVLGYRIPSEWDITKAKSVPVVASAATLSTNEA